MSVIEAKPVQTATTTITIKGLSKNYGKFAALKGLNLTIPRGTIFGLLGPNGAGKSTLIKVLVGSTKHNAGEVQVLGLEPFRQRFQLRPHIGYMPQAPALYEDLPARDNIAFFGAAHRLPNLKKDLEEVLDFINLADRQHDPVFGFSGGMKQRVSLACALIHKPQVLFLDEPTAGVDPKLRETFWQHFRKLAEQGVTLFISTHLMDEALLCDHLAIMRDGAILIEDTPKNIMRRGQSHITVVQDGQSQTFTTTNYPHELPVLLRQYQLDPTVSSIEIEEASLETIMLDLIDQASTPARQ